MEIQLTKIRHSKTGEMLHGDIRAVGTSRKLKTVNLRCVGLSNGTLSSKDIYVSSYRDVLPSGYRADSRGVLNAPVYWTVPGLGRDDSLESLGAAKVVITHAFTDPCFEFE